MLHFHVRKIYPDFPDLVPMQISVYVSHDIVNLIDNPGKGKHIHRCRLVFSQYPGTFIYRRTRGEDIIHQQYYFIFYFLRPPYPEGAPDISAPLAAAQPGLGVCPAMPFQDMGLYFLLPGGK